jgi:rhomboid protease GluP
VADERRLGALDRAVELLAKAMNAVGLNGTRLLWKWSRRRERLGEAGLKTEILWRSARTRFKMCPSCRALVRRSSRTCPDCGASLSGVRAPGVGRLLANVFPGVTATTSLLMLVNGFWFLMIFLAQMRSGGDAGSPFVSFGSELLVRFGSGLSRPRLLPTGEVTGGEWWRLITPIFLHGGLLHFVFNSLLLMQLGPLVEELYGTARYWVLYLGFGIAGSLASQLPRYVNTVGASGAIMGLIGLLLVHGLRHRGALGERMKGFVLRLLVYSVVLSVFFPRIDHLNHLGGIVAGALAALLVSTGPYRSRRQALVWGALSLAGVALVLLSFYQVAAHGRAAGGG